MRHALTHGPSFAMLRAELAPGDRLHAESGAMVARGADVAMRPRLNATRDAGFFGLVWAVLVALARKVFGGESFVVNEFTVRPTGGQHGGATQVLLAPTLAGEIAHRTLNKERLLLQAGSFLASSGDLDVRLRWGGLRTLFAKEGLFLLEVSGSGDLFYNAYGGCHEIVVDGALVVDNGHVVAFDPSLDFKIRSAGGGLFGFVASGEGLVCEFRGRGRVVIQSRNLPALSGWLSPLLPS